MSVAETFCGLPRLSKQMKIVIQGKKVEVNFLLTQIFQGETQDLMALFAILRYWNNSQFRKQKTPKL